jgi:hypothetical protein
VETGRNGGISIRRRKRNLLGLPILEVGDGYVRETFECVARRVAALMRRSA